MKSQTHLSQIHRAAAVALLAAAFPAHAQHSPAPLPEPNAAEQLPPAYLDAPTRIEQVRQGRRITEVVVTPRGFSHSYRMANPDLKPLKDGPTDNGAGLSVPRFVRFSF